MMKTKALFAGAALAVLSCTQAAAFDGLSVGVTGGLFNTYMDKTHNKYPHVINTHDAVYGVFARYIVGNEDGIAAGAEVSLKNYGGKTINAGRGKESVNTGLDLSGIIGYRHGPIFPHFTVGASFLDTDRHENDGLHYGIGVSYQINDHLTTTFRATKREFDGPWQGSDLDIIDYSVGLSWRF